MNYVIVSYGTYLAGFHNGAPWFTMVQNSVMIMGYEEAQEQLAVINSMGYGGAIQEF